MKNLINLVKSIILRNKGKTASIALILILGLSSALAVTKAQILYGQNPGSPLPGSALQSASEPGVVTPFNGGIEIVEPTAAQIAYYAVTSIVPDMVFTVAPNPVGVGQVCQFIGALWNGVPDVSQTVNGVPAATYGGWGAFQWIVTASNGTQIYEIGPPNTITATSGGETLSFTFSEPGTYNVTCNWLGELVNGTTIGHYQTYFEPESQSAIVTVQTAPVPSFISPPIPTPTQYWTMPICSTNYAWNVLCGPWLDESYNATCKFNPYTYAPDSAHILWQFSPCPESGGLVGGDYGPEDFPWWSGHSGSPMSPDMQFIEIINGYFYADGPNCLASTGQQLNTGITNTTTIVCYNLFTGKLVWQVPGAEDCASIENFRSGNEKYCVPLLWDIASSSSGVVPSTSWYCYDARTGTEMFQVTGCVVPAKENELVYGPVNPFANTQNGYDGGGSLLVYSTGTNSYNNGTWISCWDSNRFMAVSTNSESTPSFPGTPVCGKSYPYTDGIDWNMTINYPGVAFGEVGDWTNGDPTLLMEVASSGNPLPVATNTLVSNGVKSSYPAYPWTDLFWCVDQTNGQLLWNNSVNVPPFSDQGVEGSGAGIQPAWGGAFTIYACDSGNLWGFSEYTGAQIWNTHICQNSYGQISINTGAYYFTQQVETVGYGCTYIGLEDGYMHCVNMTNGVQIWQTATQPGGEVMPEPNFPIAANDGYCDLPTLADGKVFFTTGKEHEVNPYYPEAVLYVLNATTGVQLWNATGNWGVEAIADGVLIGLDPYLGVISAMCRGPSQTTISGPETPITVGTPVVLQGTVTDQSPALQGTPCMADSCMTQWMAYELYDQPEPANAKGVTIQLTAIDPNNNYVQVGTATSDTGGYWHFTWTPPNVPGTYDITATFSSTNSYYGSCSETSCIVVPAAGATPAPTVTPTSVADMYFVPAIAGLFVLIIVVAIVLALLMLRKKP